MSVAAALAELIRSPALPDHIAHLQRFLADEQARRAQFRANLDPQTRTEFINGQVVIHADVPPEHAATAVLVAALLGQHAAKSGQGKVLAQNRRVGCQRNDYEPDLCYRVSAASDAPDENGPITPPPDLIIEVLSPPTESNDRHLKFQDYAAHGVAEYWIVDPDRRLVEQFVLLSAASGYQLKARLAEGGLLTSTVLTGFSTPVSAFFAA